MSDVQQKKGWDEEERIGCGVSGIIHPYQILCVLSHWYVCVIVQLYSVHGVWVIRNGWKFTTI